MNLKQLNAHKSLIAAKAAAALLSNAQFVISRLPATIAHKIDISDGEIIAASTNLALSVELFFKAVALIDQIPFKRRHELLELFRDLTSESRVRIEDFYKKRISVFKVDTVVKLHVALSPKGIAPPKNHSAKHAAKSEALEAVLEAEDRAFVEWRYFFEQAQPTQITSLSIELRRLEAIALSAQQVHTEKMTRYCSQNASRSPSTP